VHCDAQIDWLAAHKTQNGHRVFLKMNSGMNRLGFTPERFRAAWARLNALPQVEEISFMTHFSDADAPAGQPGVSVQLQRFHDATRDLPGERSVGNSAATLRHGDDALVRCDWVRPGIVLYGSSPDYPQHTAAQWDLQPTQTLSSRIIGVQQLAQGQSVGYGSRFTADGPVRLGTVACGYADGYPRHCGTGTPVLVNGVRTRTLARARCRHGQRGHAVGPRQQRRRAAHRRGGRGCRHAGLRAHVRRRPACEQDRRLIRAQLPRWLSPAPAVASAAAARRAPNP
jgi:alanine racemase